MQGCDVNLQNNVKITSLILAADHGYIDIVNLLLTHDANVNLTDEKGRSAIGLATCKGHIEIIKLLLQKHANVNITYKDGRTPLFYAVQFNYVEIAKLLLERGADINRAQNTGATPLFIAAQNGNLEIVKLLLKYDADTNLCLRQDEDMAFKFAKTQPWEICRRINNLRTTKILSESKSTVNITPLEIAEVMGHLEISHVLRDHKKRLINESHDDISVNKKMKI